MSLTLGSAGQNLVLTVGEKKTSIKKFIAHLKFSENVNKFKTFPPLSINVRWSKSGGKGGGKHQKKYMAQ